MNLNPIHKQVIKTMSHRNDLNRTLYVVLKDLKSSGMTREASHVIKAAERIAAATGPELLNSNHITQVGRAELGLHGGQRTKIWETFGPVLGWFRIPNGPARGVPVPQIMPGESMPSFTKRCQQWLQQYASISGQNDVMAAMQRYFSLIQSPANMKELEDINQKIYQEFNSQFAAANAKAKQRQKNNPSQIQEK